MIEWICTLAWRRGELVWSGYDGTGNPKLGPPAYRIDVGSDFMIGEPGKRLYCARVSKTEGFTPTGLVASARAGMFGFKLLEGR